MTNDLHHTIDHQNLEEKYEHLLQKVVHLRKTYPRACASYLSCSLQKDVDMLMKAEVAPNERPKDAYSPQYLDNAKLKILNVYANSEPFANKDEELSKQTADIRFALNLIRSARHKNVQQ